MMIRVVGLLVAAAVYSVSGLALAQADDICTLPAGVTVPPDPRVTAQQVENGSASLMDFALAVRDLNREIGQSVTSTQQVSYLGCLVRQEGSSWRSGDTYLIQLTPDGRVLVHAKDMALSGRLLNPIVYGTILHALGINPTDLANPAAAQAAFTAAIAGNGGAFNVPGVPGASGYAFAYFSSSFRLPLLMLAGFDLNASHLIEEQVDYGDPAVTASDVVDRDTLKAFVEEAGKHLVEVFETGNPAAASQARIALRDMNGPWRHGSVYLYVLDTVSNIILFHGAFPDRYELQPLVPTVRDAVTGEFVQTLVIEAAKSSPEGGFIRYHFDDPTDATDSADIPKVGYAREFTGSLQRPDGSVIPLNYIVGSGFYLSDPNVTAVRQSNVIENVLPQIMRTMTASTVDAISGRIEQAYSGASSATSASLGGASTFSDALLMNAGALGSGTFDLNRLLAGSSFTLPLNQNGSGASGPMGNLTLWGNADYRNLSDSDRQTMAYDGNVVSANLGFDTRLNESVLGGLSVSLARGTVEYTDRESVTGEFSTRLSSVNPYVGWRPAEGTSVWATAGYGTGEVEFDGATGAHASDLTQHMAALGVNRSLASSERFIAGGNTNLKVKGELAFTRADVEATSVLQGASLSADRHRLMLEAAHTRTVASEATLTPSVELGVRYDGGDGQTGAGVEVGAGLGYSAGRLAVRFNARTLLAHNEADEYEESGFSGMVTYQPRSDGGGVSMTLGSTWGLAHSGVQSMWSRQDARALARGETMLDAAQLFQAELRYGLHGPAGRGLWLPYLGTDSGYGSQALRLGVRLRSGSNLEAGIEIGRRESVYRAADHAFELRGSMLW